uniref:Uncharacterized protein n=1 Tax=Ignisphaera aggregans TaxID=334771 RepID=A0A7J2TB27_9CREN
MSTTSYNDVVEALLKLHKCYRVQGLLNTDIITRVDFFSKPHVTLALATMLWVINSTKRNTLGYSDIVALQRRTAIFLVKSDVSEIEFLKKLLELAPSKLGLDIASASRRCMVEYHKLVDVAKLLNLIKEIISLIPIATQLQISENLKRSKVPCLNDYEMLPSTNAIADTLIKTMYSEFENMRELLEDPYFAHAMDVMKRKIKVSQLKPSDIVAFSLVILAILRYHKGAQICIEPGIDVETLCKKIYNDLTSAGADPTTSDIYTLYQELSMRSLMRK